MLNLNKHTTTKPKPTHIFNNCSRMCVSLCTDAVDNTAQNSFPSYPPDNHHSSDDVCRRGGGYVMVMMIIMISLLKYHISSNRRPRPLLVQLRQTPQPVFKARPLFKAWLVSVPTSMLRLTDDNVMRISQRQ